MASRRELKELHEAAVLASFGRYLRDQGIAFSILDKPDPPDAIVELNGRKTWIEITDVFYSTNVAISITSYAADDMPHRPSSGGLVFDPDSTISERVSSVIREKFMKKTMCNQRGSMGPGILLVGLYGPFFDISDFPENLSEELKNEIASQQVFDSMYVYMSDSQNGHAYKAIK